MRATARSVIEEALWLPPAERATVVAELLASMDGDPDSDADEAWATEIERRAERALSGESAGKDWGTVRAEIEANRGKARLTK